MCSYKNRIALVALGILLGTSMFAQGGKNIGIGIPAPDNSAVLHLEAVGGDQGFLMTRLTTTQIQAIAIPALGLITFNVDDSCYWFYRGNDWEKLCGSNFDSIYATIGAFDTLYASVAYLDTIYSNYIEVDSLVANYIFTDSLIANWASFDSLFANYAYFDSLFAQWAQIDTLLANYINVDSLVANYIYTDSLLAQWAQFDSLFAQWAQIDTLLANYINVDSLIANYIYTDTIIAGYGQYDTIVAGWGSIDTLYSNYISTDTIVAGYGSFDTLFVNGWNIGDTVQQNTIDISSLYDSVTVINDHLAVVDSTLLKKWDLRGNGNTNASNDFIGTTDARHLIVRTNNTERLRVTSGGRVGIGTTLPGGALDVRGTIIGEGIQITTSPTNDHVLTSDGSGTGTWEDPAANTLIVAALSNKWDLSGNSVSGTDFIGTTNNADLHFKVNSTERMRLGSTGDLNLGNVIGTTQNKMFYDYSQSTLVGGFVNSGSGTIWNSLGFAAFGWGVDAKPSGGQSIAMGRFCTASAQSSLAMGDNATSSVAYQATFQFAGGFRLFSNGIGTAGVTLAAGSGTWVSVSDSTKKTNFSIISSEDVLSKLTAIPVKKWSYISQTPEGSIQLDKVTGKRIQWYDKPVYHIGPMAQDFYAAFGLGIDDTGIASVDLDGVNMVAIQALAKENEEMRSLIIDLRTRVNELERR